MSTTVVIWSNDDLPSEIPPPFAVSYPLKPTFQ